MHIVLVGDYPQQPERIGGGVEAVVLYLSQALQNDADLRVSVVTLTGDSREPYTAKHGGVEVYYVPTSTVPSRLSRHRNIHSLRDQIVALQPDLVHAHGTGAFAFAAAESRLPWVLTVHGIRHREMSLHSGLINRYRAWMVARDEHAILKRAEVVIAISPFVQTAFGKQLAAKVYTIDNPIAEAFFQIPDRHNPGQILYAGRLNPRKDIMTLLTAFAQVHAKMPEATLRLAGSGNVNGEPSAYYLELRRFVVEAGLDRAVTFLGHLDDAALMQEYADCAVLALSSKVETAPMAILQAMAAGKPVVSTDAGGARYLVRDGDTGFIVPIEHSHAMHEALFHLLRDEAGATDMGRRGKAVAEERFRAAVVAQKTRAVYKVAVSNSKAGGAAQVTENTPAQTGRKSYNESYK